MKRLEKILVNIVGTMMALYAIIVLLFSLPFMQQRLAGWTAHFLSRQVKSNVEIGSINLGLLNRIIVNDLTIYEPTGQRMAHIARVSASVNVPALLSGQVDIGTAQLFGVKAHLWKATSDSLLNIQFLIDAFKSDKQEETTETNLHIGSLIMRHANVSYDVLSEEKHPNQLDVNHLQLQDCGMNVMLRCLTNDSINLTVRRLQAKEKVSGLAIKDTRFRLIANRTESRLSDVNIALPHSQLTLDSLHIQYGQFQTDSTFVIESSPIHGRIMPYDLAPLYQPLAAFTTPILFDIHAEGSHEAVHIKKLAINTTDEQLVLQATARMDHPLRQQSRHLHADIHTLHIGSQELSTLVDAIVPNHDKETLLEAAHSVDYHGTADYDADGTLESKGQLATGLGNARYDCTLDSDHFLTATLHADSVQLGRLLDNQQLGTTSFDLDLSANTDKLQPLPVGRVSGTVHNIHYNGYNYQNITVDAHSTATTLQGMAHVQDPNLQAHADFTYGDAAIKDILLHLQLDAFRPHNLLLTKDFAGENLTLSTSMDLHGPNLQQLYGDININDVQLTTPTDTYVLDGLQLHAERQEDGGSSYTIQSDIVSGHIQGRVLLTDIVKSFTNELARHLPIFIQPQTEAEAAFTYDLTVNDAPLLHHFTDIDFALPQPIRMTGKLNTTEQHLDFDMSAPCVDYNGQQYDDLALTCHTTADNLNFHALGSTTHESHDDSPTVSTMLDILADAHDNRIVGDLYFNTRGLNDVMLQVLPTVQFSDSLGSLRTDIELRKSSAVVNDTAWTVSPAHISLFQKNIECRGVRFSNDRTNSYLTIDGRASDSPSDQLVATLNDLEIEYILSLVDFTAVNFAGKASGRAVVNNVLGDGVPDVQVNLYVDDLALQGGVLGDANIEAHWDTDVEGIAVEGRIVDLYDVPDGLSGNNRRMTGVTTVEGWISPAKDDILLGINTHNTNASFIHGFLDGVFKEATGYVNGRLNVVGPLNDINLVGDVVPNMNLRLFANNVPYHIEGDTLRFRPHLFDFQGINLYDRFGHRSTLDGQVTHHNMKNFAYHFKANLHEMLAYDETRFNSDKFMGTVFADGQLSVDGADGHPLYVNASVTPTRGSVFAYDAATPDAITGNSFIEFRDRDTVTALVLPLPHSSPTSDAPRDSLAIVRAAQQNYSSDIFINFDINLTPACEVKLRMDNIEDGYIRTFGNAKLTAQWYNKGSFQLFGNYNIQSGSYRLYLQDIIFRDLALQPGSMVEFNGNPFDANIHLICHHTLNAVPLSDLTATTALSQNNKVKVICILDITGKLGGMDFKFDMEMPNVSEEVRQLVRSIIYSDEEMNTQMIYLLGLGRFYPNQYARANGNDNSSQAVNSLLSSTLSGQINQMLSSVIGDNSNWNFGSSLSTGEQGWNDLDVEGILEGRLLDERLLINGNFGYRDNALTNQANFIGDFEVKWRMTPRGNLYVKAYNQTNDRYFTKATLNTQGLGLTWQHDFEVIRQRMRSKKEGKK